MKKTIIMGMIAAITLLSTGCNDKLEVQQMYGFSVTSMPLQAKIGIIESVKMQFKLIRIQKYDGATIVNKDAFVYGGVVILELETFITDRIILLVNVREWVLWGSSVGKYSTQLGVGAKYIIN